MRPVPCALLLAAALATGCMRSLTTTAFQPAGPNRGVAYSLPQTRLQVTLTYTIQQETRRENGIPLAVTETVLLAKPVVVEPRLGPDPANRFVLAGDGLVTDPRLDSNFKIAIGDNQLLSAVAAAATDATPKAVASLVGASLSLAKLAAAADSGAIPAPLAEIRSRLAAINQEMAVLAPQTDPKKLEKIAALVKEQQALLAFAAKYRELNSPLLEERQVTHTELLDLRELAWDAKRGCWSKLVKAPGAKLGPAIHDNDVPGALVTIFATAEQQVNATAVHPVSAKGESGVLYRAPAPLRATVTLLPQNLVVLDERVPFAQAGPVSRLDVRCKPFTTSKTTIAFSPATGSVKEYGVDTGSSAEGAAKALDASLAETRSALVEIQKAQAAAEKAAKDEELANLVRRKKLAETEADLLQAQEELEQRRAAAQGK